MSAFLSGIFNVHTLGLFAGFLLAIFIKMLLDFHLAVGVVKYFWWIPVRSVFRRKTPDLSGSWNQLWETESPDFATVTDRHGTTTLRQFGNYCYAEHYSKGVKYSVFGRIKSGYFSGEWYDSKSELGYFGTFQLRIVTPNDMRGSWSGFSTENSPGDIKSHIWKWTKNEPS